MKITTTRSETLRQKAYDIIQGKLLEGELRAGDVVSEQALAAEIGMSRTPVREAIGQLQLEGLFDKAPRVGTTVRLPDRRELGELYTVREAIESHAAGTVASTGTVIGTATGRLNAEDDAMLGRLHRELLAIGVEARARGLEFLDEPLLRRFFHADIGFHFLIVRATGNRRALALISEFRVIQRVFEYERVAHGPRLVESAAQQHGHILHALRQGDAAAAHGAMAAHIRASRDHALAAFDQRSPHASTEPNPPKTTEATEVPEVLALPTDLSRHIESLSSNTIHN